MIRLFCIFTFLLLNHLSLAAQSSHKSRLNSILKSNGLDTREFVYQYLETDSEIHIQTSNPKVKILTQYNQKPVRVELMKAISWALVNLSVANIRTAPKHSAELSTQSLLGHPLKVYEKKKDWYLVQTSNQYIGWVDKYGLQLVNQSEYNQWLESERVYITKSQLSAWNSDQPITDLVFGNIVVRKKNNLFLLPDNRQITLNRSEYIPLENLPKTIDLAKIKQLATNQLGKPYLWGGTSTKGLDCSGFSSVSFLASGILLRRDASLQVLEGIEISPSNIQLGDLIFWGNKQRAKVSHVGIYLDSNQFIHSSGRVRLSSLETTDSNYESNREMTNVRRITNEYLDNNKWTMIRTHPWYFKTN